MANVRNFVVVLFALTASASEAFATERDAEKLRLVARAYLHVTDVTSVFQQSRCGRFFSQSTESLAQVMDELSQNMKPDDFRELQAFLKSEQFAKTHQENQKFLDSWYGSFAGPEYDEQTTCEMIASGVAKMHDYAKEKWDYERRTYAGIKPESASAQ
ncbi:MAG: hypothetical protein ACJ8J7_01175 [Sulfurifustaceae bacterium]